MMRCKKIGSLKVFLTNLHHTLYQMRFKNFTNSFCIGIILAKKNDNLHSTFCFSCVCVKLYWWLFIRKKKHVKPGPHFWSHSVCGTWAQFIYNHFSEKSTLGGLLFCMTEFWSSMRSDRNPRNRCRWKIIVFISDMHITLWWETKNKILKKSSDLIRSLLCSSLVKFDFIYK